MKMKNKEKYAKEIVEIVCEGCALAVSKETGKPNRCGNVGCEDCMRYTGRPGCAESCLREWAESEYIEKPVISRRDRAFLECFRECAKWMTRDGDGTISVWDDKPNKSEPFKMWMNGTYNCVSMFNIDFPMVKWSDSEPWLIEDLKKLEVVEDYE